MRVTRLTCVWQSALAAALLVGSSVGCSQHAAPTVMKSAVPAIRDTLVDAGGYRLHFRIVGSRTPVIVLESGGGADASQWTGLQSQLAQSTGATVVSYDRAGFGESDLPQAAYDAKQEVAGLHKGLEQLGLASEVILVGHSYGGLLNQIYAKNFPTTVKGIVLIDPNTVAFVDAIGGPEKLMKIPFDEKLPLSKAQQAGVRQIRAFDKTVEAARHAPIAKYIPVTVITAGKPWWPKPEQSQAYRAGHELLVADVANRSLIVAEGSGHQIPDERPDVVASAVETMLAHIKAKPSLIPPLRDGASAAELDDKRCAYDQEKLLSLDEAAFDQDLPDGGWRKVGNILRCEAAAAELIAAYRSRHPNSSSTVAWHQGQMLASAGLNEIAIPVLESANAQGI